MLSVTDSITPGGITTFHTCRKWTGKDLGQRWLNYFGNVVGNA